MTCSETSRLTADLMVNAAKWFIFRTWANAVQWNAAQEALLLPPAYAGYVLQPQLAQWRNLDDAANDAAVRAWSSGIALAWDARRRSR